MDQAPSFDEGLVEGEAVKTSDWELGAHERPQSSGTVVEYVQVAIAPVAMFMTTTEAGALVSPVHVR